MRPPPQPRAEPGLAAARGTEGLLVCVRRTPLSPASAWDPSQGLLWLPGPGLSVAMAAAREEALGGKRGVVRGGQRGMVEARNSAAEVLGPLQGQAWTLSTAGLWQSGPHTSPH